MARDTIIEIAELGGFIIVMNVSQRKSQTRRNIGEPQPKGHASSWQAFTPNSSAVFDAIQPRGTLLAYAN
jgi:hypothetical protein